MEINGIHYHDSSVTDVAKALRIVNPSAANYPEASLIDHMRRFAEMLSREGHTTGGTLGYVISIFTRDDGKPSAVASLSPYSVLQHLGQK